MALGDEFSSRNSRRVDEIGRFLAHGTVEHDNSVIRTYAVEGFFTGEVMKILQSIACIGALMAGFAGVAGAADAPSDSAAYKQKLHDCQTQMKTDHADMNHDARRKACRKQLGSAPKSTKTAPAAAPATLTP